MPDTLFQFLFDIDRVRDQGPVLVTAKVQQA
jgi:hypothetical protein